MADRSGSSAKTEMFGVFVMQTACSSSFKKMSPRCHPFDIVYTFFQFQTCRIDPTTTTYTLLFKTPSLLLSLIYFSSLVFFKHSIIIKPFVFPNIDLTSYTHPPTYQYFRLTASVSISHHFCLHIHNYTIAPNRYTCDPLEK